MNVFELVASLTLDTKEYERGLKSAKGIATGTSQDITKSVANMKKGALVATGAIAAGLTAFGVSSMKAGMEFDTSMSQVAATMGKTNAELQQEVGEVDLAWGHFSGNLREYAQEMGKHTAFSATEAADALNYMALAGYDTQKSMQMLPNVLNLAAAGNMELATASDMVTDASSALGLSTEETTALVDKMAMASTKSNTSVSQLGEAYLTVGGTAKQLKGGTTELSTALGILADNGIKGSEGGTILRNAITSLTAPTSKAQKELDALGVSVFDSEGNMRSMNDIMMDLSASMADMTGEERAEAMSKIFNKRDLKGIEALLAGAGDRWNELSGYIDKAQGSAQKMADTQLDNLQGDITLLKSAWEGLQISVSDKATPALRGLVQALTRAIDHASTLGPIILGVATAFGVFAVAINIGSIIGAVTTAMTAFNAVLAANPIGIVVALIAGLVVAFTALWKNNETFRNKVIEIWNTVKDAFITIFTAIKSAASTIWNGIKDNIIKPIENAYTTVASIMTSMREKASSIWGGVKSVATQAWTAVKNAVLSPIRSAQSIASSIWNRLRSSASSAFNSIRSTAASVWNGIKNAIIRPIESAKNTVSGIMKKIKNIFPLHIGRIFSGLSLPHISVSGGKAPFGIGGKGSLPHFSVAWHRKAEDQPYMFTGATLFGAGEGTQDEMLYGKNSLMKDISTAVEGSSTGGQQVVITNYITVDGAENPEQFAERFARKLKLDMRMV